ncbi:hypothetical protein RDABS01_005398 [Bienertia sinuspersici]
MLATNGVLNGRHIRSNGMCSNCSCAEESIVHAIFNCSHVRGIWMESSFHELIVEAPTSSFGELLLWLIAVAVQRVKARWSANVAEAVVAWYGMQLVRGLEARKVWLESDALSVVTAVNGHGHVCRRSGSTLVSNQLMWSPFFLDPVE